jgi:hypothetical protein
MLFTFALVGYDVVCIGTGSAIDSDCYSGLYVVDIPFDLSFVMFSYICTSIYHASL